MLYAWRNWTKKELKARVAELRAANKETHGRRFFQETSLFGEEIAPNATVCVVLKRNAAGQAMTYARVTFDTDCNIVKVV